MTPLDAALAALVAAHADLREPTITVSEETGRRRWGVGMGTMWLVKRDSMVPAHFEQRSRAVAFLTEWCARHAPEIDVYVDGRAPPGWLEAMVELEDRLGPMPPCGASGIAGPRAKAEYRLKRDELMRWQDDGGKAES